MHALKYARRTYDFAINNNYQFVPTVESTLLGMVVNVSTLLGMVVNVSALLGMVVNVSALLGMVVNVSTLLGMVVKNPETGNTMCQQ